MLFRPMMLRATAGGAVAKYSDSFETYDSSGAPTGWSPSTSGSAAVNRSTVKPFNGASSVQLTGDPPNSASISKSFSLTGCTQFKIRVAGTSLANIQGQGIALNFGGANMNGNNTPVGLVSAVNTGVSAPFGTWFELLFNISDTTGNFCNLAAQNSSAMYFDLLEIF